MKRILNRAIFAMLLGCCGEISSGADDQQIELTVSADKSIVRQEDQSLREKGTTGSKAIAILCVNKLAGLACHLGGFYSLSSGMHYGMIGYITTRLFDKSSTDTPSFCDLVKNLSTPIGVGIASFLLNNTIDLAYYENVVLRQHYSWYDNPSIYESMHKIISPEQLPTICAGVALGVLLTHFMYRKLIPKRTACTLNNPPLASELNTSNS